MQFIIKNDKVQDVKFSGSGCVISQVSASLLTDKFKGLSVDKVKKFQPEEVLKMLNLKLNPARVRCALISLEAAKKALK